MRLRRALLTIPALTALLTGATATASAAPVAGAGAESVRIIPPAACGGGEPVKDPPGDVATTGRIWLLKSRDHYWACVEFWNNLTPTYWGMARLHQIVNGTHVQSFHCDSPDPDGFANGRVKPGQKTCRTPKRHAPWSNHTFIAEGNLYRGTATLVARGTTGTSAR